MNTIFLSGLPKSGATLLCSILSEHPYIRATPTSPLCNIVNNMRSTWSHDSAFLAQLDSQPAAAYDRITRSLRAFIDEYGRDIGGEKKLSVDKSRGWLHIAETLRHIDPDMKMIVPIRDPRAIFGIIELRHRQTLLMEFPDGTNQNLVASRAADIFSPSGIIGSALAGLANIGDIPEIMKNLFIVKYEVLVEQPDKIMDALVSWLGISPLKFSFDKLAQLPYESDSHYNLKAHHQVGHAVRKNEVLENMTMSPRIMNSIVANNRWFYEMYYPEVLQQNPAMAGTDPKENTSELRRAMRST